MSINVIGWKWKLHFIRNIWLPLNANLWNVTSYYSHAFRCVWQLFVVSTCSLFPIPTTTAQAAIGDQFLKAASICLCICLNPCFRGLKLTTLLNWIARFSDDIVDRAMCVQTVLSAVYQTRKSILAFVPAYPHQATWSLYRKSWQSWGGISLLSCPGV